MRTNSVHPIAGIRIEPTHVDEIREETLSFKDTS
jgi:hypothetical protein